MRMMACNLLKRLVLVVLYVVAIQCEFVLTAESLSSSFLDHDIEPRSTSNKFLPGPNGELCILNEKYIHDTRYEYQDGNGRCCCSLCSAGRYIEQFCQCGQLKGDHEGPEVFTECVLVEQGKQYMNASNMCTQPYICSTSCKEHQIKVKECTIDSDIICECEDGWYNPFPLAHGNTIPEECRSKPHCPAGQAGIHVTENSDHEVTYSCQPCQPNSFQKDNDSTSSCQPHRICQIQAGNAQTDNICINDELVHQQSNTNNVTDSVSDQSDPTGEVTVPTEEVESTSVPPHEKEQDQPKEKGTDPDCDCRHGLMAPFLGLSVFINVLLIVCIVVTCICKMRVGTCIQSLPFVIYNPCRR